MLLLMLELPGVPIGPCFVVIFGLAQPALLLGKSRHTQLNVPVFHSRCNVHKQLAQLMLMKHLFVVRSKSVWLSFKCYIFNNNNNNNNNNKNKQT